MIQARGVKRSARPHLQNIGSRSHVSSTKDQTLQLSIGQTFDLTASLPKENIITRTCSNHPKKSISTRRDRHKTKTAIRGATRNVNHFHYAKLFRAISICSIDRDANFVPMAKIIAYLPHWDNILQWRNQGMAGSVPWSWCISSHRAKH